MNENTVVYFGFSSAINDVSIVLGKLMPRNRDIFVKYMPEMCKKKFPFCFP